MAAPILYITLLLLIVISSANCATTVPKARSGGSKQPEVKQQPKSHAKPCCCCNGFSSSGGPDLRFERAMREIVQYALWKFHTLNLQEAVSQGIQMSPQTIRTQSNQMIPMMAQASQISPMMISPQLMQPTHVIEGQQKNNLGPFGMKISNGLVDMGVGMHGANFGMDQKTLRDLMEATANLYGRAGISMGFNP